MKRLGFLFLSLLLVALIPGCFTIPVQAPNTVPPVRTPPVIVAFNNTPSTVNPGGTSTLLWNVTGADSLSIDQGIGQVEVAGIRVVSPASSTVYTISATNSAGTVTRSTTTMVNSANPVNLTPVPLVTRIVVGIDEYPFTGPCPKTIQFWGTITTNGPGILTYQWEKSDGTTVPGTITFLAAGSQTVINSWTRGEGNGWQRLRTLVPNDAVSNQLDFEVTCWNPIQ